MTNMIARPWWSCNGVDIDFGNDNNKGVASHVMSAIRFDDDNDRSDNNNNHDCEIPGWRYICKCGAICYHSPLSPFWAGHPVAHCIAAIPLLRYHLSLSVIIVGYHFPLSLHCRNSIWSRLLSSFFDAYVYTYMYASAHYQLLHLDKGARPRKILKPLCFISSSPKSQIQINTSTIACSCFNGRTASGCGVFLNFLPTKQQYNPAACNVKFTKCKKPTWSTT